MLQILNPLALELHAERRESELRRAHPAYSATRRLVPEVEAAADSSPIGTPELRLRRADGCD